MPYFLVQLMGRRGRLYAFSINRSLVEFSVFLSLSFLQCVRLGTVRASSESIQGGARDFGLERNAFYPYIEFSVERL